MQYWNVALVSKLDATTPGECQIQKQIFKIPQKIVFSKLVVLVFVKCCKVLVPKLEPQQLEFLDSTSPFFCFSEVPRFFEKFQGDASRHAFQAGWGTEKE